MMSNESTFSVKEIRRNFTFVVVGGGIAGVSCVENLGTLCPEESILLVSSSPIVKSVKNFKQLTRNLEEFDVCEKSSTELRNQFPNITVVHQDIINFDPIQKKVGLLDGSEYYYKKLCICTGASPKVIAKNSDFIVGIRDTETVCAFEKRLSNAKRVIVVGNGGIATELVFKIQCCEVLWAIKDDSIISTFIDPGASRFLLPHMIGEGATEDTMIKRIKYSTEGGNNKRESNNLGCALGPDWTDILTAEGKQTIAVGSTGNRLVSIEYKVEIKELLSYEQIQSCRIQPCSLGRECDDSQWPVYARLTNGKVYGCDFIVSATGVVPNVLPFTRFAKFKMGSDGGVEVDDRMRTSVEGVFAAGDVCTAAWKHSPYWLQMRLWSQARQMGHHAAECMVAELRNPDKPAAVHTDFCFELFAHVTKFFNYKVILLGRFNGQGLDNNYKLLIKVIEGEQYVKVVLKDGKMVGAILIGETDLEETFENLILNQLDLTPYGDDLLDHDIEDYFD